MFSIDGLTDDQLHAIWHACREIVVEPDTARACRRLADDISRIISAPAVVFRRDLSRWKAASEPPASEPDILSSDLDALTPWTDAAARAPSTPGGARWTPVPLGDDGMSQALLLLPGDWSSERTASWLPRFATTASLALRVVSARHTARRAHALAGLTNEFARKLGDATALPLVHQLIVETGARAAHARLVSLTVQAPRDESLAVAATYGYPRDAVGGVRITPGSGIVGSVFLSRRSLLVRDTARVPNFSPASTRYLTASFMALPIVAGREAIGVLTLADRVDGAPFTRENLAAARLVARLSGLALARAQLAALTEDLAQSAATDALTGLFNRRYLDTRLEAEIERGRRLSMPVAVLMLDVDDFKMVNDRLGHPAGDAVLRRVADILKRSVRASDVCTRYGGDEFAVIVPENATMAAETAARIRRRVERFDWTTLGIPADLTVTLSTGIAVGEVGEAAESLIRRADEHLYQAKALGRNRVHPADA